MSRRTVRYIKFPKIKSHETSCRTAKVRCEPVMSQTKPRRRPADVKATREGGPAQKSE